MVDNAKQEIQNNTKPNNNKSKLNKTMWACVRRESKSELARRQQRREACRTNEEGDGWWVCGSLGGSMDLSLVAVCWRAQ